MAIDDERRDVFQEKILEEAFSEKQQAVNEDENIRQGWANGCWYNLSKFTS